MSKLKELTARIVEQFVRSEKNEEARRRKAEVLRAKVSPDFRPDETPLRAD